MKNSSSVVKWNRVKVRLFQCPSLLLAVVVTLVAVGASPVWSGVEGTSNASVRVEPSNVSSTETTTVLITEGPTDGLLHTSSEGKIGIGNLGNIYPGQSVQSVLRSFDGSSQQYPTVNKCCPFFSRYEAGECVQAQNFSSSMVKMKNEPFWEAPKAMVTLLGKDLDGMEISNDTVVFR